MNKKNNIIFTIIIIFLILFSINLISAKTINIEDSSNYGSISNSYDNSTNISNNSPNSAINENIQRIIDNSNDGDTINFKGDKYNNLTLIINKKLNIISTVNTKIENSNPNNSLNTIFLINSSAIGTNITGFNFENIYGNIITINNYKTTTKSVKIFNNLFNSCEESSIYLINSININIYENEFKNSFNGVYLKDCENILIKNNTFQNNQNSGIYLNNNIENVSINWNVFNNNLYGLIINSENNDNLNINQNTIVYSIINGILFEENFKTNDNFYQVNISLNAIFGSGDRNIYAGPCDCPNILLGANWMGSNDLSMAALCPLTEVTLLQAKLTKDSFGKFSVSIYLGRKKITDIPPIEVKFRLNGNDLVSTQLINGTAYVDYSEKLINLLEQDNTITARVTLDTYTINILTKDLKEEYENFINEGNGQGNGEESGQSNGTGNGTGNGNGTGSGIGNETGNSTGGGTENGTGSGDGVQPESGDGTDTGSESENVQNNDNKINQENSNKEYSNTPKESSKPITAKAGMTPGENSKNIESANSKSGGGSSGGDSDNKASEISIVQDTPKTNDIYYLPIVAIFFLILIGSLIYNKKTKFR
ncbi:hypothetical protein SDC9_08500 [bioreactor metagenome]|uniref:Right handed beta helix domain-containing protein n=1 Tax=bioreactor metagenome TaxID=1076179 RepID=A0A644T7T3_9ZZZZ|nr:hypothetical protein [Methanobrevibacter sp.]MEA4957393.1 hypothetical protein [Methanobrevibacter sp.]